MSKRLFIGLELPAADRAMLAALDPHLPGVRWVASEQMHLTLSFLGEVRAPDQQQLLEALRGVRVAPFFLPIEGVGAFGGARPTVLWAGVGRGHPHLFALHKHVQDAVLLAGLEADLRPFHPHITLGRIKGASRESIAPFLKKHARSELGMWEVRGFALFSSVLTATGPRYDLEMRRDF